MPDNDSNVSQLIRFYAGTQADYDTLASPAVDAIRDNYLYFITDTKRIYKGKDNVSGDINLLDTLPSGSVDYDRYDGKLLIKRTAFTESDKTETYNGSVRSNTKYKYNAVIYDKNNLVDNDSTRFRSIITPLTDQQIMRQLEYCKITNPLTESGQANVRVYTDVERTKLKGIEAGAEVNVQPDWNMVDTDNDAFILNKPKLYDSFNESGGTGNLVNNPSSGLPSIYAVNNVLEGYVGGSNAVVQLEDFYGQMNSKNSWTPFKVNDKNRLDEITDALYKNVQSNWTSTDSSVTNFAYIQNKPSLQSYTTNDEDSWTATGITQNSPIPTIDGLKNKLKEYIGGTDVEYRSELLDEYYKELVADIRYNYAVFSKELKTKLDGIETNANKYILPTATPNELGGIKVGTDLSISESVVNLTTQTNVVAGSYGNSDNITLSPTNNIKVPYVTVNSKGITTAISEKTVSFDAYGNIPSFSGQLTDANAQLIIKIGATYYTVTLAQIASYCKTYAPDPTDQILTAASLAENGGNIVQYGKTPKSTVTDTSIKGTAEYATNLGTSTNKYTYSTLKGELDSKAKLSGSTMTGSDTYENGNAITFE